MGNGIEEREQRWNWDKTRDRTVLIVRRMQYDHPLEVLSDYGKEFLKEVFLKKYHMFDRLNRNFWRVILKVSDEELEEAVRDNPRLRIKIWNP